MGLIEVAVIVATLALVALTCFAIPVLVSLKNAMVEVKQFTARADIAVQELHEVLGQVKTLAAEATERLEEVRPLTEAVSETSRHVRTINSVLGSVTGVIAGSSMWVTGAKVAGKFMLDRFTKKGGKKNV